MLIQTLTTPFELGKFYAIYFKTASSPDETYEMVAFNHNSKNVFFGFSYAPFIYENTDTIEIYKDDLEGHYEIIEVTQSTAVELLSFFKSTVEAAPAVIELAEHMILELS